MHQLMRECLQRTQEKKKPESVKRIHKAINKYYSNKLKNINIQRITLEHENAFTEAFYHTKESPKQKSCSIGLLMHQIHSIKSHTGN